MLRRVLGASLLTVAFVCLPTLVDAQAPGKKGQAKPQPGAPIDSAKLQPGEFVGTLKSSPGSDRTFTLTIDNKRLEATGKGANPGRANPNNNLNRVLQAQQHLATAQQHLATARNPQQAQQARQQMIQAQNQMQQAVLQMQQAALRASTATGAGGAPAGYRWVENKQDVEFQAMEEVKVRTVVLPEQFDEKGLVKKYNAKELEELKGKDKSLPGFESAMDKVSAGAKVKLVLAPAKKAAPTKDKDADEDKNEADKKMQVKLIIILEDAPLDSGSAKGKGKAKKK